VQLWKGEGDLVLYYATPEALSDPSAHRDEHTSSAPAVGA